MCSVETLTCTALRSGQVPTADLQHAALERQSVHYNPRRVAEWEREAPLENWRLVDLNGTGFIPCGNASFFFHIENLAAAHPVERFL